MLTLMVHSRVTPTPCLVCGLDYIFAISGGARIVSTDPAEQPGLSLCHPTAL